MKLLKSFSVLILLVLAAACSNGNTVDDDGGDTGCGSMCVDAGFSGGDETDFGGGVIECLCPGSGVGIQQEDCNAYCSNFDVAPQNSFVTDENSPADKCVCDGTAQ